MAKALSENLKLFRLSGPEYRPARWMRLSTVVIAATSLSEAKRLLKDEGISASGDWFPIKITSTDVEATLALANARQPVWDNLDRLEAGWHVGGRDAIEAWIAEIYGDGPYPRLGPFIQ